MTEPLKMLLESVIHTAADEGTGFVGVTISRNPPKIAFWCSGKESSETLAQLFETLARDMRAGSINEVRLSKPS